MKISLLIPKKEYVSNILSFLDSEIEQAQNIKNKSTRKSVTSALKKIKFNVDSLGTGKAYYSDGEQVIVGEYDGVMKSYHCGNDYTIPEVQDEFKGLLVCFDAQELYIGEFNGKEVRQLYHKGSLVPNKHNKGGQSQRRFERGRIVALKHWLKQVAETTYDFSKNRPVGLGCNSIYRTQIEKYLSNNLDVTYKSNISIDDNCLWQIADISRYS